MSGAGSSDSGLDLSGKLIIKAQLGDDIRRIPIHNEDMTYDELILMMQRVFRGSLSPDDDITLKYKDEDGDLVTIFDSSDLAFAIQCSRILRLTILPNGQKSAAVAPPFSTLTVRRELRAIRDRVTALLDTLDVSTDIGPKATVDSDTSGGNSGATGSPAPNSNMQLNVSSKEFDPLQASEQQQPTQQQQPKAQTNSQQHPPVSTPTPAAGAQSEAETPSSSAGPSQGEKSASASASASSTPAPYHLPQQKPQVPPSQQPPQQQPTQQQQQHPGYPGFGAARAPAPQHGMYLHIQGQHYGAGGDVSGAAAPRSGVPPNTMTPGAAGSTATVGPAQQQQYYQGYQSPPQFQGYPVSSSQPAGYPQQYPGQQYPPTYTQAGLPNAGPQAAQQGPPTGPRPPMSRYPAQPSGFQQQWGQ